MTDKKQIFQFSPFLIIGTIVTLLLFGGCDILSPEDENDENQYEQTDYDFEWVKKVEDISSYLLSGPRCASDSDGNLIFSVSFSQKMAIDGDSVFAKKGYVDEIYIVKYNPDGEKLWGIQGGTKLLHWCGGNVINNDNVSDIQIDKENNIYVLGTICGDYFEIGDKVFGPDIFGSDDLSNCFLMKIRSDGNIEWVKGFIYFFTYFKLFPNGDIIIVSPLPALGRNVVSSNRTLTKMNSKGEIQFTKEISFDKVSIAPSSDWGGGIAVSIDMNNDIFINAGVTINKNDTILVGFDGKELLCYKSNSSGGGKSGFIARYSQNGDIEAFAALDYDSGYSGIWPDNMGGAYALALGSIFRLDENLEALESNFLYEPVLKDANDFDDYENWKYANLELEVAGSECYIYGYNNGLESLGGHTILSTDTYLFGKVGQDVSIEWIESYPEKKYSVRNVDIPSNMPKYIFEFFEGGIEFNTGDIYTTSGEAGYIGKMNY
ncbi:MAG TPA: hypothetical protein PLC80_13325 [Draconibacterium sp.]|nr:hypothetical protein [Draconibacterium sp.]